MYPASNRASRVASASIGGDVGGKCRDEPSSSFVPRGEWLVPRSPGIPQTGNVSSPFSRCLQERECLFPPPPNPTQPRNVAFPMGNGSFPMGTADSPLSGLVQAGNASFPVLRISAREGTSHSLSSKSRAPGERRGSSGEWPWRDALSPCCCLYGCRKSESGLQ